MDNDYLQKMYNDYLKKQYNDYVYGSLNGSMPHRMDIDDLLKQLMEGFNTEKLPDLFTTEEFEKTCNDLGLVNDDL